MVFTAIPLVPHYAVLAAVVIAIHWYWLFWYRHKTKSASPGKAPAQLAVASPDQLTEDPLGTEELHQGEALLFNSLVGSTSEVIPVDAAPPSLDQLLCQKYAGSDASLLLSDLEATSLEADRLVEINHLARLTNQTSHDLQPNELNLHF